MRGLISREIALDVKRSGVQARIPARQGDSLVYKFIISLYCGGQRLSPDDAAQARVIASLPDGQTVYSECTYEGRRFVFTPGSGFFAHSGTAICRLCLRAADGAELYSPAFAIENEGVAGFDGARSLEVSNLSAILRDALAARAECEAILEKVKAESAENPVHISTIVFGEPTEDGGAFSLDISGGADISVVSDLQLNAVFEAPLRRVIVASRTPTYPECITGVNLEMRLNGGDTVAGTISGFHSYFEGYRYGEMCVDTLRPWNSYSSSANTETSGMFTKNCMVRIYDRLAGVRQIRDLTLTCTGKVSAFPAAGKLDIFGIYA